MLILLCIAGCCGVLQYVAVGTLLEDAHVWVMSHVIHTLVLAYTTPKHTVQLTLHMQYIAQPLHIVHCTYCSHMQYMQCTIIHTATHCNTLQHTATHCNTLQHTATHCNTLQHTATHCNTLQHTATHCNTLQHTATHICNIYAAHYMQWRNSKSLHTVHS